MSITHTEAPPEKNVNAPEPIILANKVTHIRFPEMWAKKLNEFAHARNLTGITDTILGYLYTQEENIEKLQHPVPDDVVLGSLRHACWRFKTMETISHDACLQMQHINQLPCRTAARGNPCLYCIKDAAQLDKEFLAATERIENARQQRGR